MISRRLLLAAAVASVAALAVPWLTAVPLGVAGEWTWDRIPLSADDLGDVVPGWVLAVAAAALYIGFVWLGGRRLTTASGTGSGVFFKKPGFSEKAGLLDRRRKKTPNRFARLEVSGWLAGLTAAGLLWLWVIQHCPPGDRGSIKRAWVLYDPRSSGYFFEAAHDIDDARSFLSGYEARIAAGEDVLHVGTHPPGLFLAHYGLIEFCRSRPEFSRTVLETQPASVAEAFARLEDHFPRSDRRLDEAQRAALWLAVLLTELAAAAAVVPLYLLTRQNHSREAAWRAASFWPLVPALAVFLPKSDALYPLVGLLFLWLSREAIRRPGGRGKAERAPDSRTPGLPVGPAPATPTGEMGSDPFSVVASPLAALAAGFLLFVGLLLSLAMLPVLLLAVFLAAWELWLCAPGQRLRMKPRDLLLVASFGLAGFVLPVLVMWLAFEVNLPAVWYWNYANHAAFYDQYPRTWWKWLLVNPLELALAAGPPLVVLAAAGVVQRRTEDGARHGSFDPAGPPTEGLPQTDERATPPAASDRFKDPSCGANETAAGWRSRRMGPLWGVVPVWGLLWLTGKNMGEAARLWIPFIGWLAWLGAGALASRSLTSEVRDHEAGVTGQGSGVRGQETVGSQRTTDDGQRTTDDGQRTISIINSGWLCLLALQAAVCIGIATRVSGFDFLVPRLGP